MSAFLNKLNTKMLTAAFVLSVIALPALADVPIPTLDRVKTEQSAFLDTDYSAYSLTEITADVTAPEGAITINIAGKEYFYTPTDNKEVLQLLSSTGSTALIETTQDKALYTTPEGKYYTYDTNKLKDSAYTLTEVASADEPNTITLYDKKEVIKYYDPTTGKEVAETDRLPDVEYKEVSTIETTPKYYTVSLKQTEYGNPNGDKTLILGWEKNADTGNLEFKQNPANPVGQAITYKYNSSDVQTRFTNSTDNSSKTTTGVFVGQTTGSTYAEEYGGAIYNNGDNAILGDIIADFLGNYAQSNSNDASGGAIYNGKGTIGNITGDFIGNYAFAGFDANGGAIYNRGIIGNITGDFIGNYTSPTLDAHGGAIYNGGTIGDITGNFIGNYISNADYACGGAIYNWGYDDDAIIGNISGDFIGNYASSSVSNSYNLYYSALGGAIYNSGSNAKIESITGDFIGNYVSSSSEAAMGGAIYNSNNSTIGNITGDFIGNYAYFSSSEAYGGAIYNSGTIADITGNFIGNYASLSSSHNTSYAYGGAIYNKDGIIGNITGNFIGNYASSLVSDSSSFYHANGGAIYNRGVIGDITGDFIGNYASAYDVNSSETTKGGAIYNYGGTIGRTDDDGNLVGGIYGSFINNYVSKKGLQERGYLALGGAVYTTNDMNFIADNQTNIFTGNYTEDYRGKLNNAIFVQTSSSKSPTIKLQVQNNGAIVFDDQIDGGKIFWNSDEKKQEIDRTNSYNLALTGDKTGTIYLNNDVINANISLDNTNLYLGRDNVFDQSQSLTLNSGSMSMINNQAGTMNIPTFNLNGTTNLGVDVDLANKQMDTIKATNYNVAEGAKLNVNNINLLNDAKEDLTNIQFTDNKDVASATAYTGASPIAYSPIYKYEVSYNPDEGFFTFSRGGSTSDGGGSSNPSDAFNPAVLAPSVATQAGAYTTQLQTFNYAFQHADTFMNIPYLERVAMKNTGRYAVSPTGDAIDVGTFSPLLTKEDTSGFWVKPYASFENIPLNNGPKVSNINYGTLVGYDSSLTPVAKGWERVLTGYIGYNGASQRYSGVDAYQNGGILGGTATMYKGNFFNATTLSVGATAGDASTMYGNENYAMLLAGIGNKTGYNFEFKDGRIILQPNFLISYTFVNTFDYTNGAGVRIKSDPLNAIQLAPGLKLIGNTKNGWQPYLSVAMIWNLLDDSKVTANDVRLPEMSIDPYVQYGAGIQKRFKDRFIAFGQAMIHNGGRNGVSLTAGLRWTVGK